MRGRPGFSEGFMGNPVQGGSEFVERVRRRPSRKGVSREIEGNKNGLSPSNITMEG